MLSLSYKSLSPMKEEGNGRLTSGSVWCDLLSVVVFCVSFSCVVYVLITHYVPCSFSVHLLSLDVFFFSSFDRYSISYCTHARARGCSN